MCSLGKILAQDFQMAAVTKILMRREKSIAPLLSLGDKHLKHKNAQGDCDAVIAKADAVVTHVQSLSQEVGSGDEGLGLFGFDLSSAETDFWWLGEGLRRRNRNQYMASTWGRGILVLFQMSLIMLAEKHETSPPIYVFRITYFCPSWKRPSPSFQYVPTTVFVLIRHPSQSILLLILLPDPFIIVVSRRPVPSLVTSHRITSHYILTKV